MTVFTNPVPPQTTFTRIVDGTLVSSTVLELVTAQATAAAASAAAAAASAAAASVTALGTSFSYNLVVQSQALDQPPWVDNFTAGTVTANTTLAPDGTTTADTLTRIANISDGRLQVVAFTGDGTKTVSWHLKQGTSPAVDITLTDGTLGGLERHHVRATWTAGVPVLTTIAGTGTLLPVTVAANGFYRIAFAPVGIVAANINNVVILPSSIGANGDTVIAWGAQVEPGSAATPYLATTTIALQGLGRNLLDASQLLLGTVPPVRLGSGAAIAAKFLRGDSTWQAIAGGGDALVANPLSQFAATTSLQLAGVLSDETGTGALVFATNPTITVDASVLASGTLPSARFPATLPAASGINLTALNATNIASGTMATARLGSGAAGATTFLRGDSTWGVPLGGSVATLNTQVASYQVVAGDLGKIIEMNVAGANTLTVPTNATAAFAIGSTFSASMTGAGVTTLTPAATVTFRNISGATLAMLQSQVVSFYYEGADVWYVSGLYYTTLPAASGANLTALPGANIAAGTIVNASISAGAAIAYSKLALTGAVLNADLAGSIAYSKLALTGALLNADLAGSIAYSKLALTGAVLNADLAGSVAYAKLALTGAVLNADLAGSIADSKLATISTAGKVNASALTGGTIMLSGAGGWPSTTTGASGPNKTESVTNKVNTLTLDFSDSTSKLFAEWTAILPPSYGGGTITFQPIWTAPGVSTASVVWGLAARAFGTGVTIDQAFGTAIEVISAHTATALQVIIPAASAALTIAGSPAAGQVVQFRLYRDSANASDTLAATVSLLGVQVNY